VSWFVSILIGLLTAGFGALFGFFVADQAVRWLRVSTFEGAAGYAVMLWALLALIGGLVVGIVVSRWLGGPGVAGAARGLGYGVLILGVGIVACGGLAWLAAEHEPEIAGQALDLGFEVRLPAGMAKPVREPYSFYASLHSGGRSVMDDLHEDEMHQVDGHWIVPGTVPIVTARRDRVLGIVLKPAPEQYFDLPLPPKPGPDDQQWSGWFTTSFLADRSAPLPDQQYWVRYRVQFRPPPPYVAPDREATGK